MKRVLHVITGLGVGGAERMLLQILPAMNRAGELAHEVLCLRGRGPIGAALQSAGVAVQYLDDESLLTLPRTIVRFARVLRRGHYRVMVTHLIHADLLGRVVGRLMGVPAIVSYKHGALLQWEALKYFDRLTSFMVRRYITVSQTLRESMIRELHYAAEKIVAIPNGVDLRAFAADVNPSGVRVPWGLDKADVAFGIIANLRTGKGHLELLEAYAALRSGNPAVRSKLAIVGDGEERASIEKHITRLNLGPAVIMAGYRDDLRDVLAAIDIFVLPTHYEGMSVVLLEAMAAGKPIITTSIPENREVVQDGDSALLVPAGDVPALAWAMGRLLADAGLRRALGARAKSRCYERFSLARTMNEVTRVLTRI